MLTEAIWKFQMIFFKPSCDTEKAQFIPMDLYLCKTYLYHDKTCQPAIKKKVIYEKES